MYRGPIHVLMTFSDLHSKKGTHIKDVSKKCIIPDIKLLLSICND